MQFFHDEPLPEGLWLVKWIDRVQLAHSPEAAKVSILLQRMRKGTPELFTSQSARQISELIGSQTGDAAEGGTHPVEFIQRPVLASYLPMLRVGDLVNEAGTVGRLPTKRVSLRLDGVALQPHKIAQEIAPPPGWSAGVTFRVLNRFEYSLGPLPPKGARRDSDRSSHLNWGESNCLLFKTGGTEYILPKTVIFSDYYGFSSKIIHALLGGSWDGQASKLISFANYESGIYTGVDQQTGAWNIVLQPGVDTEHAARLALLWFDEHARRVTNQLYIDSLQQNTDRFGSGQPHWYFNADIPHRVTEAEFKLSVCGYSLRQATIQRGAGASHARFLITSIVSSSWPSPPPKVFYELHRSNQQADERVAAEGDRAYAGGRPSVEGDASAIATSSAAPDASDSTNLFYPRTFEYIDPPVIEAQRKTSSQVFSSTVPRSSTGQSSLVSGAVPTYAQTSPAPAEGIVRNRRRIAQFDLLYKALDNLVKAQRISSCEPISPVDRTWLQERDGHPCWTLLAAPNRRRQVVPNRGWTVVFEREEEVAARHARCVLVLRVELAGRVVILMEIEPRPSESSYSMYAFKHGADSMPEFDLIKWIIDGLRSCEGRPKHARLADDLGVSGVVRVHSIRHSYEWPEVRDDESSPIGLREDVLLKSLQQVLAA